jgi:E3 ubiquitin-protein ligase BAH
LEGGQFVASMKFAHEFVASLKKEEYPPGWLDSAISYRKLKKCIKKVEGELRGLGLDPKILEQLWQNIHTGASKGAIREGTGDTASRPYLYRISSQ